jgi:hypothetical protein
MSAKSRLQAKTDRSVPYLKCCNKQTGWTELIDVNARKGAADKPKRFNVELKGERTGMMVFNLVAPAPSVCGVPKAEFQLHWTVVLSFNFVASNENGIDVLVTQHRCSVSQIRAHARPRRDAAQIHLSSVCGIQEQSGAGSNGRALEPRCHARCTTRYRCTLRPTRPKTDTSGSQPLIPKPRRRMDAKACPVVLQYSLVAQLRRPMPVAMAGANCCRANKDLNTERSSGIANC